jgi:DNA helicase IV
MALAATVLAEFAPDRLLPESVRSTGEKPWHATVPATDLVAEVRKAVEAEAAQLGRGTLAVIAADPTRVSPIGAAEQGGDPQVEWRAGLARLPAQLHTPVSAKGLEFDVIVIVDPERIRAHNPADLYISMTRATQRLGLLHVER